MRTFPVNLAMAGVLALSAWGQSTPSMSTRGSSDSSPATANPSPAATRENRDPLLDLPELPHNRVTLIGGTIVSLDEVMNRMVVQPFGGKQRMKIAYDTRTHFYADGKPVSYRDIHKGQRIYFDSMLNGSTVFAKTIWIRNSVESGTGRGQVVDFDAIHGVLTVRDELSNQPVKLRLTRTTVIQRGQQRATVADLVPGSLVSLDFGPQRELRQVNLLAKPGTTFVFAGRITYLDVSRKLIAVDNKTDRNKYDISIEAIAPSIVRQLHEGEDVNISAVFDGSRYAARTIEPTAVNTSQQQAQ